MLLCPVVFRVRILLGVGALYLDINPTAGGQVEVIPAFLVNVGIRAADLQQIASFGVGESVVQRQP